MKKLLYPDSLLYQGKQKKLLSITALISFLILTGIFSVSAKTYGTGKVTFPLHFIKEQRFQDIRGTVKDNDGNPFPGVTVVVKGAAQRTVTDARGSYSFTNIPENATLVFSFIGMKTQEIPVAGKTTINVVLEEDAINLQEVVAIGYGSVKKQNLTTSVSKITSDDIGSRPITTLSEAFAGQLAGVRAQSTTGIPGEELQIRIRGINTINGSSEPLYVIDGVPKENMRDINPSDIESVQILKDASATSIYGSRGANGVVLIETKQGKGKPSFNFESLFALQDPEKFVGMMNKTEWLAYNVWMRNERYLRDGGSMSDPMASRPLNRQIPAEWFDPNTANTDWQKAITQTAPMQSYQLSGSAKSDLGSIYASGGYLNQEGIIYNSYYKRFNFRLNGILNVSKRIKVGMNLSPSFSTADDRNSEGKETVIHHALAQSPLVPLNSATRDWGFPVGLGQAYVNPLEQLKYTLDNTRRNKFSTNVWGELELIKGLTFKSQYGYDSGNNAYEFFQPGNVVNSGNISVGNSNATTNTDWILQNTLVYDRALKDHSFNFLLGQSVEQHKYFRIRATATGWPNESLPTLNLATTPTLASTDKNTSTGASGFGRASYTYKDKYILNASLRYDGSSRFGANKKWGLFPSISAGWKINEESFLKNATWISLLKIRAALGTSGNDRIGEYDYISRLNLTTAVYGDNIVAAVRPGNIENPDLQWESTKSVDIGLDFSVFNNRVELNIDYYRNTTDNLLFNVPIPNTTGFSSFRTNLGSIQNQGWELDLTTRNTTGKVKWSTSLNLSTLSNKVLDMGDITEFTSSSWDARFITRVDGPVAQFFLYRTDGILGYDDFDANKKALVPTLPGQEAGNRRYIDSNGDGLINTNDLVPYGNNIPDLIYGMTNRVSWRGMELSALIHGQLGGDVLFLGQRQLDNAATNSANTFSHWLRAWKPDYEALYGPGENPIPTDLGVDMSWNGETPYMFGNMHDNNSDFRVYDTTFLRLKNVTLAYSIPKQLLSRVGIKGARLYLSGENLVTFDNYPGVNPETNSFGNGNTRPGVDYSTYPLSRKYTLGVNLTL